MNIRLLLPALLVIVSVLAVSCKKSGDATVVIDCTGTYLRKGGNDYKVCNLDATEGFEDGDEVTAKFRSKNKCNDPSQPEFVCELLHEYKSWIHVESIE